MKIVLTLLLFALGLFYDCVVCVGASDAPRSAGSASIDRIIHFVPSTQEFWDDSKNWTTNYGPAYRDTALGASGFLPCTGKYALCFNSGPQPLPCTMSADGRFANCECTVQAGRYYVLMTGILNYQVYQDTVNVCGANGSACAGQPDKAPVCNAIRQGKFIPGANVISTFGPSHQSNLVKLRENAANPSSLTICPKAPYAGCMTAPC